MKILEYSVHYKYNSTDPQTTEKFYTPAAAKNKAAEVELWGGVAVITEELIDEEDSGERL